MYSMGTGQERFTQSHNADRARHIDGIRREHGAVREEYMGTEQRRWGQNKTVGEVWTEHWRWKQSWGHGGMETCRAGGMEGWRQAEQGDGAVRAGNMQTVSIWVAKIQTDSYSL